MINKFEASSKLVSPESRGFLNRETAAEYLGCSKNTLQTYASTGLVKLPYVKLGRNCYYKICDLDKFIESRTKGGN
jgi:hypothetical protein